MNIVFLCIMIFFVRIIDTSLATIRTVMVVKDKTTLAFIIAFFEVFVWFLIVREALNTDAGNVLAIAISYSAGYATGVFVGMKITDRLLLLMFLLILSLNRRKRLLML